MTRAEQLADAYEAVSRINHYMVGVVEPASVDELEASRQLLIMIQNGGPQKGARYQRLELAIDLIEAALSDAYFRAME